MVRRPRALGADIAYVGSAFIATAEANASVAYKQGIWRLRRRHRLHQPVRRRAWQLFARSIEDAV